MEYMTSGSCNEYAIAFILIQLVLKSIIKLKASLRVQIFPNVFKSFFLNSRDFGGHFGVVEEFLSQKFKLVKVEKAS